MWPWTGHDAEAAEGDLTEILILDVDVAAAVEEAAFGLHFARVRRIAGLEAEAEVGAGTKVFAAHEDDAVGVEHAFGHFKRVGARARARGGVLEAQAGVDHAADLHFSAIGGESRSGARKRDEGFGESHEKGSGLVG